MSEPCTYVLGCCVKFVWLYVCTESMCVPLKYGRTGYMVYVWTPPSQQVHTSTAKMLVCPAESASVNPRDCVFECVCGCVWSWEKQRATTTTPTRTARWLGMKEGTGVVVSSVVAVSLSDDSLALARRGAMRSTPRVDDRCGMRAGAPRTQGIICATRKPP